MRRRKKSLMWELGLLTALSIPLAAIMAVATSLEFLDAWTFTFCIVLLADATIDVVTHLLERPKL